jgi:hypothetical protein
LSGEGHIRVKTWAEFKRLVIEKKPGSIVFIMEQNGFSPEKEVTILRLIMLHEQRYYIFIDTPKDIQLRETAIPLHKDKNGIRFLEEAEVKTYLQKQFEGEKLAVYSFWTT